jgi:hypothetical protein
MYPEVLNRVVSGTYLSTPATLQGYLRRKVLHEDYPAIIPGVHDCFVEGVLYLDFNRDDLVRLDRFEGEYYARHSVEVLLPSGERQLAETYVMHESYRHLLSGREWNPETFEKQGIQRFLKKYIGFDRHS